MEKALSGAYLTTSSTEGNVYIPKNKHKISKPQIMFDIHFN